MVTFITAPFVLIRALLRSQSALAVENLALRQQLAVLKRRCNPKIRGRPVRLAIATAPTHSLSLGAGSVFPTVR